MTADRKVLLKQLLITGLLASKQAGHAILSVYNTPFDVEYKQDESPLTLADKRSHDIIKKELEANFPDVPILSEEGRDVPYAERKKWKYSWLVDPLDGTKEFVKRNGEFAVNIALLDKNRPVLGIIYIPVLDVIYYSLEDTGSFKLGTGQLETGSLKPHTTQTLREPLNSSVESSARASAILDRLFENKIDINDYESVYDDLSACSTRLSVAEKIENGGKSSLNVIVSRSHMTGETEQFLDKLRQRFKTVNRVSLGSSLKLCAIAEGSADVYPRFAPTMEWDTAAGQAVIEQAGGYFSQAGTDRLFEYNRKNLVNPWFIAAGDMEYIQV